MTSPGRKPAPRSRLSRRAMRDMLKPVGLEGGERLVLPAAIGITESAALRQQLLQARGRPVDLDGSAVERLGALGLQVLLSAGATWQADGQPLRLLAPSEALQQGLAVMGAADLLPSIPGAVL